MDLAAPTRVSVCVSTRDRAHLLPRLLGALAKQDLEDFEVVVTDDGSTDDTLAVLTQLADEVPFPVTVVRHETSRGPAAGRNAAWSRASAPLLAFTDDDCVPSPGWLSAGVRAMGEARRIVVGAVSPDPDQDFRRDLLAHTLEVGPLQAGWCATANVFYRRADLVAVGGFCSDFRRAACEDTDLGLSVQALGAELVFEPRARVVHDVTPATLMSRLRHQSRWEEIPLLLARHPAERRGLQWAPGVWKRSHVELVVLLVGAALSVRRPRALLLGLPWLHQAVLHREQTGGHALTEVPQLAALELAELAAVVRGSWRNRTIVL